MSRREWWRGIADQLKPEQVAELERYERQGEEENLYSFARDYACSNLVGYVFCEEIMADYAKYGPDATKPAAPQQKEIQ